MNGSYHPFRVLKNHDTKIMYVAIPDVRSWFEQLRKDCPTVSEETFWTQAITKLDGMIYEGLDHDI